jgi:hypothetical protein
MVAVTDEDLGPSNLSLARLPEGDLVVSRDFSSPNRFVLCQVPGTPQLGWPSRDEALRAARRFARAYRVDAWLSDEGGLERVHRSRRRPSWHDKT